MRKKAMRVLVLAACVLAVAWGEAAAQSEESVVMRRSAHAADPASQASDSVAIAQLVHALTADLASDSARAAAVYQWIAANIAYDVAQFGTGGAAKAPEAVFHERAALCAGFVSLYMRMAAEAGLVTEPINGYAKGFDHSDGRSTRQNNHTWLAVRLAGEWRLVDPTWGAGVVADGAFLPAFTWSYFLVRPDELILSHYPEKARWQLLGRRLSRSEFERMPAVPRTLLDAGFTAATVRSAALGGVRDFPVVGVAAAAAGARVVRAPIRGTLRPAETVTVEVQWPGVDEVIAVSGTAWILLQRIGDSFEGSVAAADAGVWVLGRAAAAPPGEFSTLLQYRVAAPALPPRD